MSLPNTTNNLKLYPTEYVNNVTVNRGMLRLLQNDEYLDTTKLEFTTPPSGATASGEANQLAVSGQYLYVYHNLSGDLNWGRTTLDYSW